jgi:hypothetical protein
LTLGRAAPARDLSELPRETLDSRMKFVNGSAAVSSPSPSQNEKRAGEKARFKII